MTHDDTGSAEANPFSEAPVSRRQFVRLSAATAGAIGLPGGAVAQVDSPRSTDRHRFVVEHTGDDYAVPTLVRAEPGAFDALEGIDGVDRTTTDPEAAAYGRLTTEAVEAVDAVDGVDRLEYSPGANPWWRLGAYPEGVFPEPAASVDYIGFEEHARGMAHLANEHADRLRLRSIGESPGHTNEFTEEDESQPVRVAELTNDVGDEAAFREKETVTFVASIHGDERAGAEASSRLIERTLSGEEPELEALLDDVVLAFVYANPDGWVANEPIYGGGRPGFQRTTATGVDPNRQYPTAGWIDPSHHPAEPDGANLADDQPGEVDDDVPDRIAETVPDSLSIVEHLRTYENANYLVDLHGMQWADEFVLGLVPNAQYDHEELHDVDAMNEAIGASIEGELGSLQEHAETLSRAAERYEAARDGSGAETPDAEEMLPGRWYGHGTIHDAIDYTTTGGLHGWAAHPEEFGGLGARSITLEMAFANTGPSIEAEYLSELVALQVRAYTASIRAVADHASSGTEAWIETGGRSTAVVQAGGRTRSSADLEFVETTDEETCRSVDVDAGGFAEEIEVGEGTWELSITANPRDDVALGARLVDPDGEIVHTSEPDDGSGGPDWTIGRPGPGTWRLVLEDFGPNADAGGGRVELCIDTLVTETDDGVPNPRDVLGYGQRDYEATPFEYFEAYAEHARHEGEEGTPAFDALSIEEVREGALLDDGAPAYENAVVIHDAGDDAYVEELSAFAEGGGSLLLTDGGVSLLESLDDGLAGNVGTERRTFATLDETRDHPLLEDVRPIQRELWTLAPMGYATDGEAPLTLVEEEAFDEAGGTVGASVQSGEGEDGDDDDGSSSVAVGSLEHGDGEIHVVGSLLPSANQSHLHPFGVLDHSTTLLGHTLVTNALGHRRRSSVGD
ncbi:M14 family zinc carboxypeptidase [Halalkalicoccus salilacus]|uniref:M14 family zinc carboxypeptidase n=1 Tax=Halalkalicoccus salilacus TaxID=3117459 RepID=UPI00300EC516